jgi:hypothetical protein
MTVEERAQDVMGIFRCMLIETTDGRVLTGVDLTEVIAQALRDQIEDCAKVAREEIEKWDRQYLGELRESVVFTIRALAGQTEQTEGKEGER